jgi:hypothetical protein
MTPPPGWEWQGPWTVEKGPHTDVQGWSYAVDFSMLSYPFHSGCSSRSLTHFVRRRRWVRQRRRVPAVAAAPASRGPAGRGTGGGAGATPALKEPNDSSVTLGVIAMGARLAVPLHLLEVSGELRVRPCLSKQGDGEEAPDATVAHHEWSIGASNGPHNVVLNIDALEATTTRLLQCNRAQPSAPTTTTTAPAKRSFASEDMQQHACYISAFVDARRLPSAGPSELDWTITLQPPLTVHNLLPVPADYDAYEVPASGSAGQPCQHGTVAAGGVVAIYTADVRQTVSLRFVPLGYQWASRGAVTLSSGYSSHTAGIGGPKTLPETFALANPNTKVALQVHVERELHQLELQTASEDRTADYGLDPGAELAMGRSLLVRVYVPIWVVNFTAVLITAALYKRAANRGPTMAAARRLAYGSSSDLSSQGGGRGRGGGAVAAALKLDTVECSKARGGLAPMAPSSHCQVLPGSCELLSYGAVDTRNMSGEEVVLQLNVLGAPWSPELVLSAGSEDGGSKRGELYAKASESLREGRPVIISAHVAENGIVLDVVAHLQVWFFCRVIVLLQGCRCGVLWRGWHQRSCPVVVSIG